MKPYIPKGTEFKTPDGVLLAVTIRDIFSNEACKVDQFEFVGMEKPKSHDKIDDRLLDAIEAAGYQIYNP